METATIIGGRIGLQPLAVSGLRELNVGVVDGLNREEAEAIFPGLIDRWRSGDPTLVFPQGEAVADFYQRARKVFADLVAEHPQGHVLVVSHVCLMSAFLTQLLEGRPSIRLAWELWNCSITQLEFSEGLVAIRCFNYHGHLDHLYASQG
jgi:probable phosphoglycerate mutase